MRNMPGWGLMLLMALTVVTCGDNLDTFQGLVKELDRAEQDIRSKQEDIRNKVQAYNQQHPDKPIDAGSLDRLMLDPDQEAELTRLLGAEKDVSYRGLVQEIVDARNQIDNLQEQIRTLQDQLPAPSEVKKGDTHSKIAIRYLTQNHNLSEAEARKLVDQTALVEEMHTGFLVWMLYKDGVFGTYVTQGTSKVSPGKAQRLARARVNQQISTLTEERNTARTDADSLDDLQANLQERILFLRDEEARLRSEIAALRDSREEGLAQIKLGEAQRKELETKLNSLYYEADTMDNWKARKVISDPLFGGPRVDSLSKVSFTRSHDLRESGTLTFEASAFPGLKRLKSVEVFPRTFRDGQDFTVTVDESGMSATVKLLKPELFTGQKVLFGLK